MISKGATIDHLGMVLSSTCSGRHLGLSHKTKVRWQKKLQGLEGRKQVLNREVAALVGIVLHGNRIIEGNFIGARSTLNLARELGRCQAWDALGRETKNILRISSQKSTKSLIKNRDSSEKLRFRL